MAEEPPTSDEKMVAVPLEQARSDKIVAMPLEDARRARGEALVALPRSKVASLRAFRRVRADRIFGILGLILVIIGVLLIFSWQKPPPIEKKYKVEWPTEAVSLAEWNDRATFTCTGYDQQGGACTGTVTKSYNIEVNQTNVTAVTFWVNWTDDVAAEGHDIADGDNFTLTFEGPAGSNISSISVSAVGGKAGMNMSYTFPMSGVPDLASVPAANEEQAWAAIGDRTNTTGQGTWKFTVRLVRANDDWGDDNQARETARTQNVKCPGAGAMVPPIPGVPSETCTPDPGNEYTFGFQITRYNVEIKKNF